MALAVALHEHFRRESYFKPRNYLVDICEREIQNYRFPKHMIQQFIEQCEASEFANVTNRSHAIEPPTEVSLNVKKIHNTMVFTNQVSNVLDLTKCS